MSNVNASTVQLHVYAGTAGHSAWFSEDGGENWLHPNSHSGMYLEARVWTFAMHDARPDRLFAGTDMGVFRWDEASARWTHLPSPMNDVWALTQDPDDADTLYAGTRPASLYRSRDAGASWQRLDVGNVEQFSNVNMGPTRVTQILFDTTSPGTVWATIEIGGIFRSDDGGDSWRQCDQGLVSRDVHGILAMRDASGSPRLFCTTNRGLHRSDDRGASWQFQQLDSPWQYTRSILAHPSRPGTILLTNGNGPPGNEGRLLRSRDYGATFEAVPMPQPLTSTLWCVATHASRPDVMFACTNLGRVYRSLDGGDSWTLLRHEFGEIRALAWRPLPAGTRKAPHAVTVRPAVAA